MTFHRARWWEKERARSFQCSVDSLSIRMDIEKFIKLQQISRRSADDGIYHHDPQSLMLIEVGVGPGLIF